jgi:hypothetical protein
MLILVFFPEENHGNLTGLKEAAFTGI